MDENPGGKTAVLLLHGLGSDSSSWIFQIPTLTASGFRVIAVDSPGFGQSSYQFYRGDYITNSANLFSEFIQYLGLERVVVCGLSMGGTQALQLTVDYPSIVERLILVSTFAALQVSNPATFPYFALRLLLVYTLGLEAQAKRVAHRIFPEPEQSGLRQELIDQITRSNPRAYRAAMRSLANFDISRDLHSISCPTVVISGGNDTTVPVKYQQALSSGIPGATSCHIPNAGHALTIDQPEIFNHFLLEFISSGLSPSLDY